MKKVLLFSLFVVFICSSSAKQQKIFFVQEEENDTLNWSSSRKLTWEDFKASPDTTDFTVRALTFVGIGVYNGKWVDGVPHINVFCRFYKNKSWVKDKTSSSLVHEQLHFDIWELYARKIRKAYDSLNINRVKDTEVYYSVLDLYYNKAEKYQYLYDSRVYFNDERQQQWIQDIAIKLNKLKKYEVENE